MGKEKVESTINSDMTRATQCLLESAELLLERYAILKRKGLSIRFYSLAATRLKKCAIALNQFAGTDANEIQEVIFKVLMVQIRGLTLDWERLDRLGFNAVEIDTASGKLEDCIFSIFGVPEDNTLETMIRDDEGNVTILPHIFCRDYPMDILMRYTSDREVTVEKCFKDFKEYVNEDVAEYLEEFPTERLKNQSAE